MKLVIVESPSKIKTIERYLSDEYKVLASYGHIVDLSTRGRKNLGINLETFEGDYVLDKSRQKVADTLKKAKDESSEVFLATDPDREGEAIAVHIAKLLKLDLNTTKRLEFHEITRDGITSALSAPRVLNENLFNSQEARRMLDRIVGFELSSLLNQKINVKSAGRVQSAVLKLIVDKENEINAFVPEEYWTLKIDTKYDDVLFSVNFSKSYTGDTKIVNETMKNDIVSKLAPKIVVTDVKSEIKQTNPKPPFTTSTLQQEASSKFKYSAARTSRVIQKLYEGIQINGIETGLVTYIRTDSTRLAPSFVANASQRIVKEYGAEYLGRSQARGKALQNVQDAHEAIRPTNLNFTPESIKDSLTREEYNLYALIYARALASLMVGSKEQVTRYTFNSNGTLFNASSTILVFPGFRKVYGKDEENEDDATLPQMHVGSELPIIDAVTEQKFTEPPARYTEGRLIKTMEELGIGRPSTYAPTIEILQKRKYVSSLKGSLKPTDVGFRQIDALNEFFPSIISSDYTASMENELDKIASGEGDKVEFLSDFYSVFSEKIDDARKGMKKLPPEKVGRDCPKCHSELVYREGPYGRFIGCATFPKCKYTEFIVEYTGENCPKCGAPLTYRYDSRNRKYIRCSNYKDCDYSATIKRSRYKK
ncbi:MAG: DNA topoisomerase 1 [Tenericutes bacterium ADurb.Bin087]|nr:MAG: DNA topoisomerase 1 [Tenericutes bacterium ADurb.Bin087]